MLVLKMEEKIPSLNKSLTMSFYFTQVEDRIAITLCLKWRCCTASVQLLAFCMTF